MSTSANRVEQFRPLMDWWVAVFVLVLIALISFAIPVLITFQTIAVVKVFSVLALVGTILYIADIAFFSYYQLEKEGLSIISQLRHAYFPYRDMVEIKPSNVTGLFSLGGKKRFALSSRCFSIKLRKGHWKSITVSPVERDGFLNQLLNHIDRERSSRASVVRTKK